MQSAAEVSGATVYTVADRASDAEAARIAEHENAADKSAGVEQKEDAAGVADILFDLKRRETRAYAHIFSRDIVEEWRAAGRLNRNPERSAGFVVLKAPDFPSVLVELGYLSSPADVKSLGSPDWRGKATSALAGAVDRFFRPHADAGRARRPPRSAPLRRPPPKKPLRESPRIEVDGEDDKRPARTDRRQAFGANLPRLHHKLIVWCACLMGSVPA